MQFCGISVKVPYHAATQIKSNDEREMIMSNYSVVFVCSKQADLMPYALNKFEGGIKELASCPKLVEHYSMERKVTLMAMFRWENGAKGKLHCLCKIRCPINPLPVKGEFEAASMNAVLGFLQENGWTIEQKLNTAMLR